MLLFVAAFRTLAWVLLLAASSHMALAVEKTSDKASDRTSEKAQIGWPAADITIARAKCAEVLNRIQAVAIPQAPLRDGACGAPAPVELISIGQDPQVSISPPATVTCDMADKIAQWLDDHVQPLAKKHLGSQIVRIENMSSYSCRNVYGRIGAKLSQHGRANALDIRGFVTADAKRVSILRHWGTTGRDIRKQLIAKRKAEEQQRKAEAARATQQAANQSGDASDNSDGPTLPQFKLVMPSPLSDSETEATLSFGAPDKLGGPRLEAPSPVSKTAGDGKQVIISVIPGPAAIKPAGPKSAFLRGVHAGACKTFGTTLGPEANEAHRNHFHIDMATRKIRNICD